MSDDRPSAIAERLRSARLRLGWSRESLAHHAGVSWPAIAQIEYGRRRNVRPATLTALADALGVSIDYLIGRDHPKELLEHRALLYSSEEEFVASLVPSLREAIERSDALLVVTTRPKVDLLVDALGDQASWVRFEDSSGWYRSPPEAIRRYRRFFQERLDEGASWLSVVGEPLWRGGASKIRSWVIYEGVVDLLFASTPLSAVCPYDVRSTPPAVIESAWATHRYVVVEGKLAPSSDHRAPEEYLFGTEGWPDLGITPNFSG